MKEFEKWFESYSKKQKQESLWFWPIQLKVLKPVFAMIWKAALEWVKENFDLDCIDSEVIDKELED